MKANFDSLRIERADNGFTVSVHYEQPMSSKGPSRYIEPDKTVHESAESVLATVKSLIGGGKSMSKKKTAVMNKIAEATTSKY